MDMFTIYWNPDDHPDRAVLRRIEVGAGQALPREILGIFESVDQARAFLAEQDYGHGLACLQRDPRDPPCVVETWF